MLALHRWVGLTAGFFFLLNGLTGAVLLFSDGVDRALNPALLTVSPRGDRLPLDALADGVRAAAPGCRITDILARHLNQADHPLVVRLTCPDAEREAVVDPHTGSVRALRDVSHFVRALFTLHSSLFLRDSGRVVLFCVGVALILASLTGLLIHGRLRETFSNPLRRRLGPRVFLTDVHRTIGLAAVLFNVTLAASGAWICFGAVQRVAAGRPPLDLAATPAEPVALDRAMASAARALPELEVNWIAFPRQPGAPLSVWGRIPSAWIYGLYGSNISFDPATGDVLVVNDVRRGDWRLKTMSLAVSLHFGHFGGTPVKLVWLAGAFAPVSLVLTGLTMWRMRRRPGRRQLV